MDRRSFLKTGAAAFALAPLLPAPPATDDRAPFKLSLKYGMVGEGQTILEKFQLLADLGYDGVELDSPSDLDPEQVLEARDATGLAIPGVVDSVHWRDTLGDPDAEVRARGRAGLETALRDCHRFGGTTVLLVPAVVSKQTSCAGAWKRSREEILRVLPLAHELGVRIAFENVWNNFLLSPLEAARYVDSFESPLVGWYLDVGNIVHYGWPEHWVEALGPRVLKVDVKGFSRKRADAEGRWKGFGVEIGEADDDGDWPRVSAALKQAGYAGWLSAEVRGGDRARLTEVLARLRRIGA
jgi:hexulose-6-phosphate isomerase